MLATIRDDTRNVLNMQPTWLKVSTTLEKHRTPTQKRQLSEFTCKYQALFMAFPTSLTIEYDKTLSRNKQRMCHIYSRGPFY